MTAFLKALGLSFGITMGCGGAIGTVGYLLIKKYDRTAWDEL